MREVRFEVFQQTPSSTLLRFHGEPGAPLAIRELKLGEVEQFAEEAEDAYSTATSPESLLALGSRLYAWLDGSNERWLANRRPSALAVYMDSKERLRHLPWELMAHRNSFLCVGPAALCPIRLVNKWGSGVGRGQENRPLRLLFLACSPEGIYPILDFEQEEAWILETTREPSVELEVEESGTLAGLTRRVESAGEGYFDVVHLTGHAAIVDDEPCFFTEDDFGSLQPVSASEIAEAFNGIWPALVFLSGCETGRATQMGALPSLCERLVQIGAPAVLGWALKVGDQTASEAAAKFYHHLAAGRRIDDAVALVRTWLHQNRSPFWHLLRLYAAGGPSNLGSLVTPAATPGRRQLHRRQAQREFLDRNAQLEVCPRDRFVGRRRVLQQCLKVLRSDPDSSKYAAGVLLTGMGGLGKSSLAARLCDRLSDYCRLVWVGRVDEQELVRELTRQLDSHAAIRLLSESLTLEQRLRRLLTVYLDTKPSLFVFDDFEQNVELTKDGSPVLSPQDGRAILEPGALAVLSALLAAVHASGLKSRVIVTCRYQFSLPGPACLHQEALETLRGADLNKKVRQLSAWDADAKVSESFREKAVRLAAGNPRLLERMSSVLANAATDSETVLAALEGVADDLRENVLLKELLKLQTPDCLKLLARLAVYKLPVDRAAAEAVAASYPLEPHLSRAAALGLVEVTFDAQKGEQFFISELLEPLLAIEMTNEENADTCARGARHLEKALWGKRIAGEMQALEIHRLAMVGGEREIVVSVASSLGHSWINACRFSESDQLCRQTLLVAEDFRVVHALARIDGVLGRPADALANCERAWALCPESADSETRERLRLSKLRKKRSGILFSLGDLLAQQGAPLHALEIWEDCLEIKREIGDDKGRAATMSKMASVIAQALGDIERALSYLDEALGIHGATFDRRGKAITLSAKAEIIAEQKKTELDLKPSVPGLRLADADPAGGLEKALALLRHSLEIYEEIPDLKGTADTHHQIAWVIADMGDIPGARKSWNKSLRIRRRLGDVHGQAVTLAELAWVHWKEGDVSGALSLNLEAAESLASVRAWRDLVIVLGNLGAGDTPESLGYLAQAFWLICHVQVSLERTMLRAGTLCRKLGFEAEAATWVAAGAVELVRGRGKRHWKKEKLRQEAAGLLERCAEARRETRAQIDAQAFVDPARLFPSLMTHLETIISDKWLFDRSLVTPAGEPGRFPDSRNH